MKNVFTYILKLNDGRHYTGITKDIARRLDEHRKGRSISTKNNRPVWLMWLHESESRLEARELEVKIKTTGANRFMKTYITGNWGQLLIKPLNENLDDMMNTKGDEQ